MCPVQVPYAGGPLHSGFRTQPYLAKAAPSSRWGLSRNAGQGRVVVTVRAGGLGTFMPRVQAAQGRIPFPPGLLAGPPGRGLVKSPPVGLWVGRGVWAAHGLCAQHLPALTARAHLPAGLPR